MKKFIFTGLVLVFGLSPLFAQIGMSNSGAGSMNRNDNEEIMNSYWKGIAKNETPTDVKGSCLLYTSPNPRDS